MAKKKKKQAVKITKRDSRKQKAAARAAAAADQLRALQLELRRLRSLFKEIANRYVSKQEARITRLAELLAELKDADPKYLAGQLHELRTLEVKANKGRRKDLTRIEELARFQYERLVRKLEEQEKREPR